MQARSLRADLTTRDGRGLLSGRDDDHASPLPFERSFRDLQQRGLPGPRRPGHRDQPVGARDRAHRLRLRRIQPASLVEHRGREHVHLVDVESLARRRQTIERCSKVDFQRRGCSGHQVLDVAGDLGPFVRQHVHAQLVCSSSDVVGNLGEQLPRCHDTRRGDRAQRARSQIEQPEPAARSRGPRIGLHGRLCGQQIAIQVRDSDRPDGHRVAAVRDGRIDAAQLVAGQLLPAELIDLPRLVRPTVSPRPPVDRSQHIRARLLAGVALPPLGETRGTVRLDLVGAARQRPHDVLKLLDLTVSRQRVPVPGKCGDPHRVGAHRDLALGVDQGVQLHRDPRVHVRPAPVLAAHSSVQPQVPVNVRIQRARSPMLKLDDLELCDLFTDRPRRTSARVQFPLPRRDDTIAQTILQGLELGRELRVKQRRDTERLRRVDRPVQHEVRVGAVELTSTPLPRVGVRAVQPASQPALIELIRGEP